MNLRKKTTIFSIIMMLALCMGGLLEAQSSILLTSPNGGESWQVGDVHDITWTTEGITGNVRIEYSVTNGAQWLVVAASTENDGHYAWTVLNNVSSQCLIRVSYEEAPTLGECETRATWLWASSIQSQDRMDTSLQKIQAANLNTVFVDTPRLNGNFGYGSHERFLAFITEAKNRGLSVHAWITNGYRTYPQTGQAGVEFTDPAEQDAQVAWVMDIMATYGAYLDGIHFDYIRYFHSEPANVDGKLDAITAVIKKTRDALDANYPGMKLTAATFSCRPYVGPDPRELNDPPDWFLDWRAAHPESVYRDNMIPAHMFFQQDPTTWIREAGMDGIFPMQYTALDNTWITSYERYRAFMDGAGDRNKLYMGLGWMPKRSERSTRGYDAPAVVRKINYGRSRGIPGFSIFILNNTYSDVDDYLLINALTIDNADDNGGNAPFEDRIPSCLGGSFQGQGTTEGDVISDSSDAVFSITAPPDTGTKTVTVLSPNGGETWKVGKTYTITWSSTGIGAGEEVKIQLSNNNGASWGIVNYRAPNTGSYEFKVSKKVKAAKCLVRIYSWAGYPRVVDTSNSTFKVVD